MGQKSELKPIEQGEKALAHSSAGWGFQRPKLNILDTLDIFETLDLKDFGIFYFCKKSLAF